MVELGVKKGLKLLVIIISPETVEYFYQAGKKHQILITCGSDYHGKTKPAIELGECRCTIDEHDIENQLKEYKLI